MSITKLIAVCSLSQQLGAVDVAGPEINPGPGFGHFTQSPAVSQVPRQHLRHQRSLFGVDGLLKPLSSVVKTFLPSLSPGNLDDILEDSTESGGKPADGQSMISGFFDHAAADLLRKVSEGVMKGPSIKSDAMPHYEETTTTPPPKPIASPFLRAPENPYREQSYLQPVHTEAPAYDPYRDDNIHPDGQLQHEYPWPPTKAPYQEPSFGQRSRQRENNWGGGGHSRLSPAHDRVDNFYPESRSRDRFW